MEIGQSLELVSQQTVQKLIWAIIALALTGLISFVMAKRFGGTSTPKRQAIFTLVTGALMAPALWIIFF